MPCAFVLIKLPKTFGPMQWSVALRWAKAGGCEIALIKIFPADEPKIEPTDEIVMQPALYFPPNIEQRASLRKYTNKQKCHSFFQIQPKFLFRILSAVQLDGKLFYQRFLNLVPISKTSLKAASWRGKTFWSTKGGQPPSKDWYICQIFLFMACLYNQRFMPQLLSIIEILVNFKFVFFVNFKFVFLINPKWSKEQIQELTQSGIQGIQVYIII